MLFPGNGLFYGKDEGEGKKDALTLVDKVLNFFLKL